MFLYLNQMIPGFSFERNDHKSSSDTYQFTFFSDRQIAVNLIENVERAYFSFPFIVEKDRFALYIILSKMRFRKGIFWRLNKIYAVLGMELLRSKCQRDSHYSNMRAFETVKSKMHILNTNICIFVRINRKSVK